MAVGLPAQQLLQMFLQKGGVVLPPEVGPMVQDKVGQVRAGGVALDGQLLQTPAHPPDGPQTGGGVDNDLGHHGVVVGGEGEAVVQRRVHPDAAAAGEVDKFRLSRTGAKTVGGVLGIDPDLNGVTLDRRLLLGKGEGQPRGHPDLLPDQVHAGDHLCDRVLHLDT